MTTATTTRAERIQRVTGNRIMRESLLYIRYENSAVREMQREFREVLSDLLLDLGALDDAIKLLFRSDRILYYLRQIAETANAAYSILLQQMIEDIGTTFESVTEKIDGSVGALTPGSRLFKLNEDAINKFIDRKFMGTTVTQKIEKVAAGLGKEIRSTFMSELLAGKRPADEIMREIKKQYAVGGARLERILRTESQRVNNDIMLATYEKGKAYLHGIQYQATLDVRTCETCGFYDRNEFYYDGEPSTKDAPYMPLHPMCRCVYVPVSKLSRKNADRERASMHGPTKERYRDWLRTAEKDDPGFAKSILGKNYAAWLAGTYAVSAKFTPAMTYANYLNQTRTLRGKPIVPEMPEAPEPQQQEQPTPATTTDTEMKATIASLTPEEKAVFDKVKGWRGTIGVPLDAPTLQKFKGSAAIVAKLEKQGLATVYTRTYYVYDDNDKRVEKRQQYVTYLTPAEQARQAQIAKTELKTIPDRFSVRAQQAVVDALQSEKKLVNLVTNDPEARLLVRAIRDYGSDGFREYVQIARGLAPDDVKRNVVVETERKIIELAGRVIDTSAIKKLAPAIESMITDHAPVQPILYRGIVLDKALRVGDRAPLGGINSFTPREKFAQEFANTVTSPTSYAATGQVSTVLQVANIRALGIGVVAENPAGKEFLVGRHDLVVSKVEEKIVRGEKIQYVTLAPRTTVKESVEVEQYLAAQDVAWIEFLRGIE